jgi:hypothetical protein
MLYLHEISYDETKTNVLLLMFGLSGDVAVTYVVGPVVCDVIAKEQSAV